MAKRKKTPKKKGRISIRIFLLFFMGIMALLLFSKSKHTPSIDPTLDMKVLPPDVAKVLGTNTTNYKTTIPILLYHYVEYVQDKKDTIRMSLNIPPFILEDQIKTLKDNGYIFITPYDVNHALMTKSQITKKSIMLTFDDGYRDFYTNVFPILKKYNVKAVAYVVPGFINHSNYMMENQVEEIAKSPLVEIGAHTMHHVWLKGLDAKTAKYEITESKKELEKRLHITIQAFAYPYGAFDTQTIQTVKDAGFTTAVSTLPGTEASEENKYFLYRLRPGYTTGKSLLTFLDESTKKHLASK